MEDIKVYCILCREHILNASDKFVCGGPYDGSMFAPIKNENSMFAMYFNFEGWVNGGNLYCPRCEQNFIETDGTLLTEYGMIRPGQTSIEHSGSLAYDTDHEKNLLSRSDLYVPERDRRGRVGRMSPFVHGSIENPSKEKPEGEIMEEDKSKTEDKPESDKTWKTPCKCTKCGAQLRWPAEHWKGCKPPTVPQGVAAA